MSGRRGRGDGSGRFDGGGGRRGGGRGRLAPGQRPVSEGQRISIADQLEAFQRSDDTEVSFPPGLSNHDRAVVHAECKRYGFISKSFGKGDSRAVTVFKRKARAGRVPVFELPLGRASFGQLGSYFAAHPPTPAELAAAAGEGADVDLQAAYGSGAAGSSSEEEDEEGGSGGEGGGSGSKPAAAAAQQQGGGGRNKGRRRGRGPAAAHFSAAEVERRRGVWEGRIMRPDMQSVIAGRAALPMAAYREEVVAAVAANQVVMIAGETGCGKTTQVPQFLLEDAWARGAGCRVVCTQPRRISAISVAERVAAERGEAAGENVGYQIRLESKGGPDSSLMFCTNGVLLRMLTGGGDALADVTHLVIDEIHERDRFADFLLILVRDLLPAAPHLRVILMSATLHVELFAGYFGGCPVVRVPGFTHPVEDYYLEDVLRLTGYQAAAVAEIGGIVGGKGGAGTGAAAAGGGKGRGKPCAPQLAAQDRAAVEQAIEVAFKRGDDADFERLMEVTGAAGADDSGCGAPGVNVAHAGTGATALMVAAGKGRSDVVSVLLANGADPALRARNGSSARDWAAMFGHGEVAEVLDDFALSAAAAEELADNALALSHYQSCTDADEVDLDLIEMLLMYICGEGAFCNGDTAPAPGSAMGAVLVFLPGWDEIIRLKDKLEQSPLFGGSRYSLLPLHSMVAPAEQRRVFVRPPRGVRKIVLATNIAETAITIDDVTCVINAGRLKEKSYDPYTGVSTLQGAWVSKASERQRRGRAGRCQPGSAFHLYSRTRSEALADFQLPEIKRSPLDEMGLQVKLLEGPGRALRIADFLGKAVEPPVTQAVTAAIQLLEDIGALDERERLTSLGRHLAALPLPPAVGKMLLYGVLFRCLDPVLTVSCCMAYRDPWVLPTQSDARRAASMLRAGLSSEAGGSSDHLATVKAYNGWKAARARGADRGYCLHNYLSPATMNMVDGMRSQLLSELTSRGFLASLEAASTQAHRPDLVRAVLSCGFYPMIGRLLPLSPRDPKAKTSMVTCKDERVRIHPASVNAKLEVRRDEEDRGPEYAALIFYDEITRGDSSLYVKSCSAMHPHPLVLVAAHVAIAHDDQRDEEEAEEGGGDDMAEGMAGVRLSDGAGPSNPQPAAPTALLIVDRWLRFRVPLESVAQLMCLRVRLAEAFAATVRHPHAALPPVYQGSLETAASLFLNESETAVGGEGSLGTSYGEGGGGRGGGRYGGGRRFGSGGRHSFSYHHQVQGQGQGGGPQQGYGVPQQGYSRGRGPAPPPGRGGRHGVKRTQPDEDGSDSRRYPGDSGGGRGGRGGPRGGSGRDRGYSGGGRQGGRGRGPTYGGGGGRGGFGRGG